jgi:hypothetical protein
MNGLSDHNTQIRIINISQNQPYEHRNHFARKINKYIMADFQINLSYKTWDPVFNGNEVNTIFNSFLNAYLRIFY